MSKRSWTGELVSRLQNLFALTVWPQSSSKTMSFSEDEDAAHSYLSKDVLLFGNIPRGNSPHSQTRAIPSSSTTSPSTTATKPTAKPMFLDRYSEQDIRKMLVSFIVQDGPFKGKTFEETLLLIGLPSSEMVFDIDVSDNFVHRLQVYRSIKDNNHLYVQLFIRRETNFSVLHTKTFDPTKSGVPKFFADAFGEGLNYMRSYFAPISSSTTNNNNNNKNNNKNKNNVVNRREQILQMITIEWLRFQNPQKDWGSTNPLPGQIHPGLGIVAEMHQLLDELCGLRHRDGVLDIPEHWYNAYVYAKMKKPYKFLNPAFEGFFQSTRIAVEKDVKQKGLSAVAWAILKGQLRCLGIDDKFERIRWIAQEQISAITPRLKAYFESTGYRNLVAKYTRPELFNIDWETTLNPLGDFPRSHTIAFGVPAPTNSNSSNNGNENGNGNDETRNGNNDQNNQRLSSSLVDCSFETQQEKEMIARRSSIGTDNRSNPISSRSPHI